MYPALYQADTTQPTGYRLLAKGSEENKSVSCELEEGVTYYLKVEPSKAWANGNFTIRISRYELPADTPPPIREAGVEYEQNTSSYTDLTPPSIHAVHVEVLNFFKGIYRLTITDEDYTLDSRGTPFFFWSAEEGTFSEESADYKSVVFTADPGTAGRKVRVTVGIGDGLGQVSYRNLSLDGSEQQ